MTARKKLLIYKILLFLFAFIVAFIPGTVSRNMEVNSRVIVEMIGIDQGEEVEVTAQYVMPLEKEGTSKDVVTVKGSTLTEAVETLNTALGRRAELGHCSIVIVGKSVKPQLLGTLMTVTDVTADVYLAAAQDKASELVSDITEFMKKTGATDADFIAYSAKKAHVATTTLLNFLSDIGGASHTAFMPVVETLEKPDDSGGGGQPGGQSGGESASGQSGGGQSGGGEEQAPIGMKVENLALYAENGRAGIIDRSSARGVAWVSAPIEKGIVVADVQYDGNIIKDVSGRLIKKKAKIKIDAANNKATIKVNATIEPNGDKFNELDAENSDAARKAIKGAFENSIRNEILKAYYDAAEYDCDPLFLGRQFYRYAPDEFDPDYSVDDFIVDAQVNVSLK